jgi:predicted nucleic acid-binding protein
VPILRDTNAFSDLMQGNPKMQERLAALSESQPVVICPIVRGEILYGLGRLPKGKRRNELEANATAVFAIVPCEPIPETAGDYYAEVRLNREQKGLALNENDCWIAATALALGAVLVTRDTDFAQIDGLQIEDWTK